MNELQKEISRRRTFAIISHPDAGKTTLTEKLLLYGGAIQLAGSVKARRNQRKATSDWMELEKERGISVTSTVLQFEYQGHVLNLLDTPGHNDFSADTYRTLTAADSAVMLIDNAKGVEAQTKKLFAVCRERGVPIFTFVNKMDFPGRGPLTLLEEVEEVLGIQSVAVNWPIGQGDEFRGIYDRESKRVHLFSRTAHGASRAEEDVYDLEDPRLSGILGEDVLETLRQEIDLIDIAGEALNMERVLKGELTPVFFGSALTNFGVQPFLDRFLTMAPPPGERESKEQAVATDAPFSGFVFKIQANMDPQHRDRVAFLRVVSGKFEKDMQVIHTRTGKPIRLTRPQRLFASDRETMDEAYAGDIIGLPNPGAFILGDTLSLNAKDAYDEVPPFVPESFATLLNMDVSRHKHFEKGIVQLTEEGLVDLFWDPRSQRREPVLGAVGRLQFDVVQFRMLSEYGVKTALEPVPQTAIRWVVGDLTNPILSIGAKVYEDAKGRPVILANLDRQFDYIESKNPGLKLYRTAMLDKQHGVATGL